MGTATEQIERLDTAIATARRLLLDWQHYAKTMAEAGLVALPTALIAETTAYLSEPEITLADSADASDRLLRSKPHHVYSSEAGDWVCPSCGMVSDHCDCA